MCEICSKLTIKTPERRHWRRFGVFIINFEDISQLVLVFPLLTLNKWTPAGWIQWIPVLGLDLQVLRLWSDIFCFRSFSYISGFDQCFSVQMPQLKSWGQYEEFLILCLKSWKQNLIVALLGQLAINSTMIPLSQVRDLQIKYVILSFLFSFCF